MEILSQISIGATSIVYKALWENQIVALKIMKDDKDGICKEALCEMSLLNQLNHPHIIQLHDVVFEKRKTILVLDYADMDLSYHIKYCPFDDQLMLQLSIAVAYCHQNHIIHCDIKPQNILIKNNQIKLADFGLAQKIIIKTKKSPNVVSLWYRSPELLLGQDYSYPIDIWSIGCVWSEYLTGQVLYKGVSEQNQLDLIISQDYLLSDHLLKRLLTIDPNERITCAELKMIIKA